MKAFPSKCFESWSDELRSRSDRVRNLIGSAHWLSDGHHKEELFRQFLGRHLPSRFRITRGFIVTSEAQNNISREIDILITDSESELPWFLEGNLIVTPPGAALAQIHVKTRFGLKELTDVLESGTVNNSVFKSVSGSHLWFGAVFFSKETGSTGEFQDLWKRAVCKIRRQKGQLSLPDCVAVIDGPVFLLRSSQHSVAISGYDCQKTSPAVFLANLYDSLAAPKRTKRGEWFQMLTRTEAPKLFNQQF